jgi:hypothetical protein
MVESIKKAQPNAKIMMPELISFTALQEVIKSVHVVKYNVEKITEKETLEKKTELIALITAAKNETVYQLYSAQLIEMITKIKEEHDEYKISVPTVVCYADFVKVQKSMTKIEYDAKKITEKGAAEKMISIMKLITEAKSETVYELYISQLHAMVVQILKVHKEYKIQMPVLVSYAKMKAVQQSITKITFDAKKITKVETAQKMSDVMGLMNQCDSETEYAIYSAQLYDLVTAVSAQHADYKVVMPMVVSFNQMKVIKAKVKVVTCDAKKVTADEAATIQTQFMGYISSCTDETSYSMYTSQMSSCIKSIMEEHKDYKIAMPELVSYDEMIAIKKSVTAVKYDAKKITKVEFAAKVFEIQKLMTSCKSEAEYQLYVAQMVTMYREVSAVHKDYALKLVKVQSYSELTETIKKTEKVHFDVKSIKQHQVTIIQKKFVKLMAACKSTVQYAIYAAKLEHFIKSVKEEHSSYKIKEIPVPTLA